MKRNRAFHTLKFLFSLILLINAGSSTGWAKSSRKIKRIDTLTLQPQVLANSLPASSSATGGSVGVSLPQPVVSPVVQNGVALPPATVPLLAIAILGLLASQSGGLFSGANSTDTSIPLAFNDFGSVPDSSSDSVASSTSSEEPMEAATSITTEGSSMEVLPEDTPIAETIAQETAEQISQAEAPSAPPISKNDTSFIDSRTEIKSEESQNQCFNYRAAGPNLGKSAGVVSIGESGCNTEVIAMDYIITNSHCAEGMRGKIQAVFGLGKGQSKRAFNCQSIVAQNPKDNLDYAIIKCPGVGKHFPPVDIANRRPKTGEAIRIATHNFRGSSIRKITNSGNVMPQGNLLGPAMMTSAYAEPGNSGSGIYDQEGKWLGLLWGGVHDNGGSPSFFTPADEVMKDLQKRHPKLAGQINSDTQAIASCAVASLDRQPAQLKKGIQ